MATLDDLTRHSLPPAEFARLTGLTSEMQRMRRARKQIDIFGKKEGKRWFYSYLDVLLMHSAMKMSEFAVPFSEAPLFSVVVSNVIAARILSEVEDDDEEFPRLWYAHKAPMNGEDVGAWEINPFIINGSNRVWPAGFLIDAQQIATSLHPDAREFFTSLSEGIGEQLVGMLGASKEDLYDLSEDLLSDHLEKEG